MPIHSVYSYTALSSTSSF